MDQSRRSFLKLTGLTAGTMLLAPSQLFAVSENSDYIVGLGTTTNSSHLGDLEGNRKYYSYLLQYNLKTKEFHKTVVPIRLGHSLLPISKNNVLLISGRGRGKRILLFNLVTRKVTKEIDAPSGYRFSGHSLIVNKHIVLPLKKFEDHNLGYSTKEGRIAIYDKKTMRLVETKKSHGISPHDIHDIPGTNFFAVSHYGSHIPEKDGNAYIDTAKDSCVVIYDKKNFKMTDKFSIKSGAHFSHFATDRKGNIYLPTMRYVQNNSQGRKELQNLLGKDVKDLPITMNEYYIKKISTPQPIYKYNVHTKKHQTFLDEPLKQRRPQSAFYHAPSDQVFVTYSHSNTLGILGPTDKKVTYLDCHDMNISDVRGVTAGSSDQTIYLCDNHIGFCEYDFKKKVTTSYVKEYTYRTVHIYKC